MQNFEKEEITKIIEQLKQNLISLADSREKSIVMTKLEELEMWFEKIKIIELKPEDYDDFI